VIVALLNLALTQLRSPVGIEQEPEITQFASVTMAMHSIHSKRGITMSFSISRSVCLSALLMVCITGSAQAQILDDHFDDGIVETNTTGIGSGFIPYVQATGSIFESGSELVFNLEAGSLQSLYSNDSLDLFTSSGTKSTFHVTGGSVAGDVPYDFPAGDNGRIWLGLVTSSTNTGSFALPIDSTPERHGLWVSLYDTIDGNGFNQATLGPGTNPNDYNGQVGWVGADGTRTILAQFTYDTYLLNDPAHNSIDVVMTVSDSAYGISFGGADPGVMVQTGSLSGALPSAPSGTFKLATGIQSGGQAATSSLEIDRITVAAITIDTDFDDLNGTNIADFHILRSNFLTGTTHAQGDANADGSVNHRDFFLWRSAFLGGGGNAAAIDWSSVPEPSTSLLVLSTSLTVVCCRRAPRRIRK
jgi:hypothetical protein